MLVLDSSVCLDIINVIRWKKSSHAEKAKIFNLIEHAQKNEIDWTPIFALLESCYDRKTLAIQEEKLLDFKERIDFAFQFPSKLLKKFSYDFETNYYVLNRPKLENKSIEILVNEQLNLHYVALLKICEIAQSGLKRELAEKNIENFIDWMVSDLNIFLGIEYALALRIFGGDSKFLSMVKLGSSKEKILKAAWGTAWDLFHVRVSCNRIQLSAMMERKVYPIFVTKDVSLFKLLSPQVEYYSKYKSTKLSVVSKDEYPPNYSDLFMETLNKKILEIGLDRIEKEGSINVERLTILIKQLEEKLV